MLVGGDFNSLVGSDMGGFLERFMEVLGLGK